VARRHGISLVGGGGKRGGAANNTGALSDTDASMGGMVSDGGLLQLPERPPLAPAAAARRSRAQGVQGVDVAPASDSDATRHVRFREGAASSGGAPRVSRRQARLQPYVPPQDRLAEGEGGAETEAEGGGQRTVTFSDGHPSSDVPPGRKRRRSGGGVVPDVHSKLARVEEGALGHGAWMQVSGLPGFRRGGCSEYGGLPALSIGCVVWPVGHTTAQPVSTHVTASHQGPPGATPMPPKAWAHVGARRRAGPSAAAHLRPPTPAVQAKVNRYSEGVDLEAWGAPCPSTLPPPLSVPCPFARLSCPLHTKARVSRLMWRHLAARFGGGLQRPPQLPPPTHADAPPHILRAVAQLLLVCTYRVLVTHGTHPRPPPWWSILRQAPSVLLPAAATRGPAAAGGGGAGHAFVPRSSCGTVQQLLSGRFDVPCIPPLPLAVPGAVHSDVPPAPPLPTWGPPLADPACWQTQARADDEQAWQSDVSSVSGVGGVGLSPQYSAPSGQSSAGPSPWLVQLSARRRTRAGLLVVPTPQRQSWRAVASPRHGAAAAWGLANPAEGGAVAGSAGDHKPSSPDARGVKGGSTEAWCDEEQLRLEAVLQSLPQDQFPSANDRWRAVATALGARSQQQVASRVQRHFKRMAMAGMPVPGNAPPLGSLLKAVKRRRGRVAWAAAEAAWAALHGGGQGGGATQRTALQHCVETWRGMLGKYLGVVPNAPPDALLALSSVASCVALLGGGRLLTQGPHSTPASTAGRGGVSVWRIMSVAEAVVKEVEARLKAQDCDTAQEAGKRWARGATPAQGGGCGAPSAAVFDAAIAVWEQIKGG